MSKSLKWWTRKTHRWAAIAFALPLIVVIVTGLLLQIKKQFSWVQPSTQSGSSDSLAVEWDQILAVAKTVQSADVQDWHDIDRLDVRPSTGLIKVLCKNGWELQIDSMSAQVLSSAYRRSDLIENIHDGSFFSELAKLWLFLPNGIVLLILWCSGLYLWYLPFGAKAARANKAANRGSK